MTQIIDYRECKKFKNKIELLPNYKKILEYAEADVFGRSYSHLRDCLIEGFKWDETEEGVEYWQNVYDSINYAPTKYCCGEKMRASDLKKNYRCIRCQRIEI